MGTMATDRRSQWIPTLLQCFAFVVAVIVIALFVYRPDRPSSPIELGSSSGPAFEVQIIRPRMGLPLGGIVPPQWFGLDSDLKFDTETAGATIGRVAPDHIELSADGWKLDLVADTPGRASSESQVVFKLLFEDVMRSVRCRPMDLGENSLTTVLQGGSGALSGRFEIELSPCEDMESGASLDWPPEPLILRGSFDRLPTSLGSH